MLAPNHPTVATLEEKKGQSRTFTQSVPIHSCRWNISSPQRQLTYKVPLTTKAISNKGKHLHLDLSRTLSLPQHSQISLVMRGLLPTILLITLWLKLDHQTTLTGEWSRSQVLGSILFNPMWTNLWTNSPPVSPISRMMQVCLYKKWDSLAKTNSLQTLTTQMDR